jgi:D-3-phosphoglycerate dehydrogenase
LTKNPTPVAVTSRSFSRHPVLREELLARYQDVTFNDAGTSLRADELVAFLSGKEKAVTALEPIDEWLLSQLPDLKVISKVGVGLNMIDQAALARHGVRLSFSPGTNSRSVAELAIGLMIALLRHLVHANLEVRSGGWHQHKGGELSGGTVGIVGFGYVGREVSRLLAPFGCEVLAHDAHDLADVCSAHDVMPTDLEELLRTSDVVTLHVDLNDSTCNLLSAERLALMKPSAILLNTSRGGLVDEEALKRMLIDGKLAGAAFDAFATEPPGDSELISLPNFIATPHIGGSTEEAILAMGRAAIAGLDPDGPGHAPANG